MEASTPQESGVNNVTRDLCAGVFTGGVAYRHKLRNFFRDHFHAHRASPGVDTRLLRFALHWACVRVLCRNAIRTLPG